MPGAKGSPVKAGRAGFLNATSNAANNERIRKEERTLHCLLQQQIELGRIALPPEPEETQEASSSGGQGGSAPPSPEAVSRHVEWLLAAHRGAQGPGAEQGGGADAAAGTTEPASTASGQQPGSQGEAEDDVKVLKEKMRGISRSLWSTLSAGSASGHGTYTSRSKADYGYSAAAVEAMREGGELDPKHHRRRDAHSVYVEASARDAVLRRSGHAKLADQ